MTNVASSRRPEMGHDMRHNIQHIYAVKHIWPPVVEERVRNHERVSGETQLCTRRRGKKNRSEHRLAVIVRKRVVVSRENDRTPP